MHFYLWLYYGTKLKTTVRSVEEAELWIQANEKPASYVILRLKHIALRYRWNGEHLVQV